MGPTDYITHLRADGVLLAGAADGNLDRPVPSCPEWRVADLLRHVGGVHAFWGQIVEHCHQSPADVNEGVIRVPGDSGLIEWYRNGVERLAAQLESGEPSACIWTWTVNEGDDVAWVQRRMAQETAVHRWDAEDAAGATTAIAPELAVDGIDEFFDVFLANDHTRSLANGGTVHIHCTDQPGEWVATMNGGEVAIAREHSKGDAAIRGTASDLLLTLWRRIPPAQVEMFGDEATLRRFLDIVELD
jgi:uncharacterized protein (TIGR03083 family)